MALEVIEDPWDLILNKQINITAESTAVDGKGAVRVVAPIENKVLLKGSRNSLPAASFPFLYQGKVVLSHYLPTDSKPCDRERQDLSVQLDVDGHKYDLFQTDTVGRFKNDDSPIGISKQVTTWIHWLIHSFQNLTHLDDKQDVEDAFNALTRREWTAVVKQFLVQGEDEALMSLIVKLAADRGLKGVLQSISGNPRKILNRVREDMPLSRIQQLDAACIRDYAKRPGLDAAEKAGPRQRLLALNRIEDTNTLENKVAAWVMEELGVKSKSYISEVKGHEKSPRVRDVRRLAYNAANWRNSDLISPVRSKELDHPVMPNYPLQLDRRYHSVYNVYLELLQDNKVHDDAWAWQRSLWACTAKTMLYARLTYLYPEKFSSFSTIRNECDRGNWLESPVAPGPFTVNDELCYLIDASDVLQSDDWMNNELFSGAQYIGITGCDSVIYFPGTRKAVLVWYYYWTGDDNDFFDKQPACHDCLVQAENTIKVNSQSDLTITGFLIGSGLHEDSDRGVHCYKDKLTSILLPAKKNEYLKKFDAAIQLVMEDQ